MSPEVLAGEASGVTKACDLWALGCILYQLLSGASNIYICMSVYFMYHSMSTCVNDRVFGYTYVFSIYTFGLQFNQKSELSYITWDQATNMKV